MGADRRVFDTGISGIALGDRIHLMLGPTFPVDAWVASTVAERMLVHSIFGYSGLALSMTGPHLRETRRNLFC